MAFRCRDGAGDSRSTGLHRNTRIRVISDYANIVQIAGASYSIRGCLRTALCALGAAVAAEWLVPPGAGRCAGLGGGRGERHVGIAASGAVAPQA